MAWGCIGWGDPECARVYTGRWIDLFHICILHLIWQFFHLIECHNHEVSYNLLSDKKYIHIIFILYKWYNCIRGYFETPHAS